MDDIARALLALSSPAAPQQTPERAQTPPPTPDGPTEASQRPQRWRTLRTPDGMRPDPRQQQRLARAYAEQWYAALREWHVRGQSEVISSRNLHTTRPPNDGPQLVGQYTSGGSVTRLHYRQMHTPLGWVSESAISAACNACPLLARLRDGGGPVSLLRETGAFVHPVDRARAYALAVLELAAHLGDERAGSALQTLKTC